MRASVAHYMGNAALIKRCLGRPRRRELRRHATRPTSGPDSPARARGRPSSRSSKPAPSSPRRARASAPRARASCASAPSAIARTSRRRRDGWKRDRPVVPQATESPRPARAYSGAHRAFALVLMLIFLFGGGWAAISPYGRGSGRGSGRGLSLEVAALSRRLRPSAIAEGRVDQAASAAERLVLDARRAGLDPGEALRSAFPEPSRILGMLALDRDVEDFLDYASRADSIGGYYREEAGISREMRPLRSRYEAAFAAASLALSGPGAASSRAASPASGRPSRERPASLPTSPRPRTCGCRPRTSCRSRIPMPSTYFSRDVARSGDAERGPTIRALYPGIVVAAASDWSGGPGAEWRGGGLSPAAGNGVVIYDPAARVYCSVFSSERGRARDGLDRPSWRDRRPRRQFGHERPQDGPRGACSYRDIRRGAGSAALLLRDPGIAARNRTLENPSGRRMLIESALPDEEVP